MDTNTMKNMVILRNLPSNMIEEAYIVFKDNVKIHKLEKIENKKVSSKKEKIDGKIISGRVKRNEEGVIVAENIYNGSYCASGSKNSLVVTKVTNETETETPVKKDLTEKK